MKQAPQPVTLDRIRRALAIQDVDGREAQRLMEPITRGMPPPEADTRAPREAAALAYLFERDGRVRLPLTVRRHDLAEHRGQVSLPGGRPEPGESGWETALREAEEEVALDTRRHEPLGVLAPVYIPVTHTRLHVHVAAGADPGRLIPAPSEVARIVIVDVDDLVDPARRRVRPLTIGGRTIPVPYFEVADLFLWGATAMALSELVERVRRAE